MSSSSMEDLVQPAASSQKTLEDPVKPTPFGYMLPALISASISVVFSIANIGFTVYSFVCMDQRILDSVGLLFYVILHSLALLLYVFQLIISSWFIHGIRTVQKRLMMSWVWVTLVLMILTLFMLPIAFIYLATTKAVNVLFIALFCLLLIIIVGSYAFMIPDEQVVEKPQHKPEQMETGSENINIVMEDEIH